MRIRAISQSKGRGVFNLLLSIFLPVIILSLSMFPSAAFCDSWQPIGPEGGNFIFSMTNPANANEVTIITTSPSPSNVYRSTDGGTSWNKIGKIPSSYVYDVSAFDFSTIYAISGYQCYRSTDGGVNWTTASIPSSIGWAQHVCVDPTDSSKVYAAGVESAYQNNSFIYNMVFFKSTDGGLNWNASSFFTFDYFYPYDMAISKSNPSVMYVSGRKEVGNEYVGALLKTADGGSTWTDISSSVDTERYSFFETIAIDPTDENKVYVGGSAFYRSIREGRGQELLWERSLQLMPAYHIKIDPVEPSRIYATGYQSISVSTDYGQTWRTYNGCTQYVAEHIEVAPANPSMIYASSRTGLYKSPDSGVTWDSAHDGIYAARIAALAAAPSTVIVQNSGYLMAYKRMGRATEWHDLVTPDSCGEVCDILINPDDADTVLILEGYG
ncbi:MAG: WD40/YVTN/BNR-like repeat-containing protein [Planctomycetota bacterium]|jgi:photosystem II stability/assembly factor-like uncharacterized protein